MKGRARRRRLRRLEARRAPVNLGWLGRLDPQFPGLATRVDLLASPRNGRKASDAPSGSPRSSSTAPAKPAGKKRAPLRLSSPFVNEAWSATRWVRRPEACHICAADRRPNRSTCLACGRLDAARQAARRLIFGRHPWKRPDVPGRCGKCPAPAEPGRKACARCRDRAAELRRLRMTPEAKAKAAEAARLKRAARKAALGQHQESEHDDRHQRDGSDEEEANHPADADEARVASG